MRPFATRLALIAGLLSIIAPAALADDPASAHLLDRIAVVGASASFGFGARITVEDEERRVTGATSFADVIGATVRRSHEVSGHADLFFFTKSAKTGPRLVRDALRDEPTLFIGIDFLFWYGYGHLDRHGRPLRDEAARLTLLEEGLRQLERLECPVIVGDFPDMSPAIGRMLGENQVPKPGTLRDLNQRLQEWAADRPHVIILPLSETIEQMREGRAMRIGDHEWSEQSVRRLLQRDQLHPTAEGLVALAQLVMDLLLQADVPITSDDVRLDPREVQQQLAEEIRIRQRQRDRMFSIPEESEDPEVKADDEATDESREAA